MIRTTKTTFQEEEQNTQFFLEKLKDIKQKSKNLKTKNVVILHKTLFLSDWQDFKKIETNISVNIDQTLQSIDKEFASEISSLGLFTEEKTCNTFADYKSFLLKKSENLEQNIWYQIVNYRSIVKSLAKTKINEKEKEELKLFSKEIQDFLSKMEKMDKVDELALTYEDFDEEFCLNSQPEDYVKGLDPKDIKISEDIFQNFIGIDELLGEEERNLFEEYRKAEKFLDERYVIKSKQLLQSSKVFELPIENLDYLPKFQHIYNRYIKKGKDRHFFMERIRLEFPKLPKDRIELFDTYLNEITFEKLKKKALVRDWAREKLNLKNLAEEQIVTQIQRQIDSIAIERKRLETNKALIRIKYELMERRKIYDSKMKENEEKKRKEDKIILLEEKKKEKEYQKRVSDAKKNAVVFKTQKEEKEKKIAFNEKEMEIKKKIMIREKILENKPKVQTRQTLEVKKIEIKQQIKEEKKQVSQENQQRIEKAIESYKIRPKVERDEERMQQGTVSHLAKQTKELDKADKVELFKNPGFNINSLMKDMRYRLSTVLYEAGLDRTPYALEVMGYLNK